MINGYCIQSLLNVKNSMLGLYLNDIRFGGYKAITNLVINETQLIGPGALPCCFHGTP